MTPAQDLMEPDSDDRSEGVQPDGEIRVVRETARRRRADRRRRRATSIVTGLTVLFVVLVVVLGAAGWRATLRITGGRDEKVTDPKAPGYTAEVRPTDVQLLALTKESDELATMLLLVGGHGDPQPVAVPISAGLVLWEFEEAGPVLAADLFTDGGLDVLALRLGVDLSFGISSGAAMPMAAFEPLFEGMGPIEIELADIVYEVDDEGAKVVRYPAGSLTLEPDDVGEFLSFRGLDEAELNRSLRVEPVWQQVLAAYQANPELVKVTSEVDKGVSLFAEIGAKKNKPVESQPDVSEGSGSDGSSSGEDGSDKDGPTGSIVQLLPTKVVSLYSEPPIHLDQIDADSMPSWVSSYVPFPTSAFPGQRVVVNLLNGTPKPAALRKVSPLVVSAGGSIGMTGNAESFDIGTTEVVYAAATVQSRAQRVASELGVTATQVETLPSGVDLQVTVGRDLL